jgi:hypothetical protein
MVLVSHKVFDGLEFLKVYAIFTRLCKIVFFIVSYLSIFVLLSLPVPLHCNRVLGGTKAKISWIRIKFNPGSGSNIFTQSASGSTKSLNPYPIRIRIHNSTGTLEDKFFFIPYVLNINYRTGKSKRYSSSSLYYFF